jgi:dTDP-glucose 4,6-dehydratase
VKDRPGHDRRYAINCDKIKDKLGWTQGLDFNEGLRRTVKWYLSNTQWVANVLTGDYKKWIDENYGCR